MNITQLRSGLVGVWDRIVGPGMSVGETRMVVLACGAGAGLAAWRAFWINAAGWQIVLAAFMGLDVIGGAVCNGAPTTKRWYASSHHARLRKFAFVLPHLGYVALVAWLWRGSGFDWSYFIVFSIVLIGSTALVLSAPSGLAQPIAFAMFIASFSAICILTGLTPGLEWFAPALLLKLLVGHLVPPCI